MFTMCISWSVCYFVLGAIKLWRIKELPARFTDPSAEEQAHH